MQISTVPVSWTVSSCFEALPYHPGFVQALTQNEVCQHISVFCENVLEVLLSLCTGMKLKFDSSANPSCYPLAVIKNIVTVKSTQKRNRWKTRGSCTDSDPAWYNLSPLLSSAETNYLNIGKL